MVTQKVIIGAMLMVVSAIGLKAFAYSRLSKEARVKHITEKMARKLSLSDEQQAKVFQINLVRANEHEAAHKQGRKKEVIQNAVAKWKDNLKHVLTPEQAQKLKIS